MKYTYTFYDDAFGYRKKSFPPSSYNDQLYIKKHNLHFMTNFDAHDLQFYNTVIQAYYDTVSQDVILFISKHAEDIHGRKLNAHYSLWGDNKIIRKEFHLLWKLYKPIFHGEHQNGHQLEDFISKDEFIL